MVTVATPGVATSAAMICAVSCAADATVVTRGLPFQ